MKPHELKALAIELAAAMPPVDQRPGPDTAGPILIDNSAAVAQRLEAIAGIAGCIEAAARRTPAQAASGTPIDDAIPAACRGIGYLVEGLEALLTHTPPILRMPATPARDTTR